MPNEGLLKKYALLAVRAGVNIEKGQLLVIKASVRDHEFVEFCVKEAYEAGAGKVSVQWNDEQISHMGYEYETTESLSFVPDWIVERTRYEQEKGAAYLTIDSSTPGLMADIDQDKIQAVRLENMKKMKPFQAYTMNNIGQWCIIALPGEKWAKKVFPEKEGKEAVDALWDAILESVRITKDNDPVAEWKAHDEELARHCRLLNDLNFDRLHFVSELGTDLFVGLVKDHIWSGGGSYSKSGTFFNANMPTEEVFCMPDRNRVDGKVFASKPLSHGGKVIEDFWFSFKDGKVVDYGAKKEKDALTKLLDTDEGSRHLGEVALISYDSPISNQNILYFNTLFDENASCHLALGRCYPENIKGGEEMSEEELLSHGGNQSMNHCDFMFGTEKMSVTGIKDDGEEVEIFRDGNFVI
ncbi:MAG: aminopeptidase [Lachnospiraceae bacterium]|nr:aminopeptidase [Lachnospiraceae bacterium]